MDSQKIAGYIAQKRKEKNLTQRQLAQMLYVTHKAVSKWETAKGLPDIATIPLLCDALGITPDEFFAGQDSTVQQENSNLIISVAEKYQSMGKKQMLCFSAVIICMFFLVASSFFGDGAAKIIMQITAYSVSAIAVYKLGSISNADVKVLQKILLICLCIITVTAISLGMNYFTAKNSGDIHTTTRIAWLIFGDYSYTMQKFLLGFKNAVSAAALILGQNLFVLSASLKNK